MRSIRRPTRGARRARWRSPRSARPSRRPACCSAKRQRRPGRAGRAVVGVRRGQHPCPTSRPAFHRPRDHPAPAPAALRHPLLHGRCAAPSRTGSKARSARTPNWSSWSGCRCDGIKERVELLAITEIVLDDLQAQIEAGLQPRPAGSVLPRAARQARAGPAVTLSDGRISLTFTRAAP